MTPRLSVIEFTTPRLSFAEDLAVYREAGVDAIGIVEDKLRDRRDDLTRFRASRLQASSFFPATSSLLPAPPNPGPPDPRSRVADLRQSIRKCAPFEPDCFFVTTGPFGGYETPEAEKIVIDALHQLATEAASYDMVVAVEMMHPSLATEFTFVNSISDAIELIDKVQHPNLAVALDVWHLTDTPTLLVDVRCHAARFASIHVNDRPEPRGSWRNRLLPGDGVADLAGIFGSLATGGFNGWFELEVHSDRDTNSASLWNRDPLELVSAGRAQFLSAWEQRSR
jgi:sugar phosphate isomerase/epimerase